jgi:hypothetical protein
MKRLGRCSSILLFHILSAVAVRAQLPAGALIYASPGGSDSNAGTTPSTAVATIYHALCSLPGGNCSAQTAGSGTIRIANGTAVGGPVTGQGIWVMGYADPNYSSPPSGWLKWGGPVTLDCNGTQNATALGVAQSGTCAVETQGSPGGGPFIWLSGNAQQYTFDHISTQNYPEICLRMGVDSNGNRSNGLGGSQLDVFNYLGCQVDNSNTSAGPAVDIGSNTFWIWFTYDILNANNNSGVALTADQHQSVAVNPGTGTGAGLLFFLNDNMDSGGIKYTPGSNSASLTVQNLTTEANVKAGVWFTS